MPPLQRTAGSNLNQMTRPMRRLYVGGLPIPCYDFMLSTFLNQVGVYRICGIYMAFQC